MNATAELELTTETAGASPLPAGYHLLPVNAIAPTMLNPRKTFGSEAVEKLAASIAEKGVLQPITVRWSVEESGLEGWEIVLGERRWRAARMAGLKEIPCIVRTDLTDADVAQIALMENLQRQDLTALEEAQGYQQILTLEPGLTHVGLAGRLGVAQSTVTKALRLLSLPAPVQDMVASGDLSRSHGYALCQVEDPEVCARLAIQSRQEEWALSALETAVREWRRQEDEAAQPSLNLLGGGEDTAAAPEEAPAAAPEEAPAAAAPPAPGIPDAITRPIAPAPTAPAPAPPATEEAPAPAGESYGELVAAAFPEDSPSRSGASDGEGMVDCLDYFQQPEDRKAFEETLAKVLRMEADPFRIWQGLVERFPVWSEITHEAILEAVDRAFGFGGWNPAREGLWAYWYYPADHPLNRGDAPIFFALPPEVKHEAIPEERRRYITGADLAGFVSWLVSERFLRKQQQQQKPDQGQPVDTPEATPAGMNLPPLCQALLAALTDQWNKKYPDDHISPEERLEMILMQRAEASGIDTEEIVESLKREEMARACNL